MTKLLITSGPTREYLDPVRYLSNASSGKMGQALTQAALEYGWDVVVVSGPVQIAYPGGAEVHLVETTEEMLAAAQAVFSGCDGLIAAAAPCDFRPKAFSQQKITKNGQGMQLELEETPDILTRLAQQKDQRWVVGFALESHDFQRRALEKLHRKGCDLIVLNRPPAISADDSAVEVLQADGTVVAEWKGLKPALAAALIQLCATRWPA